MADDLVHEFRQEDVHPRKLNIKMRTSKIAKLPNKLNKNEIKLKNTGLEAFGIVEGCILVLAALILLLLTFVCGIARHLP